MRLRNRIFMPPMGDRYAVDGYVTEQQLSYYEARAKGGVGLIICGFTCVDHVLGVCDPVRTYIDDDKFIPGLKKLAQVIKRHGARAAIQIGHAGARAEIPLQPVAPSATRHPTYQHRSPRALTVGEIAEIIALFVRAAARAQEAGFDAVELHAAHSFLLSEFLSPIWNKRQDRYGGSLENRARIVVELVKAIRNALGRSYPIWCRYNCEEPGGDGGVTLAEAQGIAQILEDAGVDAIHISRDTLFPSSTPPFYPAGALLPLAEGIKKVVRVPVLVAGRISPEVGNNVIGEGKADLIGFGRGLIVDPELPSKLKLGKPDDIIPCIRCNKCFGERKTWDVAIAASGIRCSVNAAAGREKEFIIEPAKNQRRVLVVGGGPGGMEAARVATLRGHRVSLCERHDKLGGQLWAAAVPPLKDTIRPLIDYLTGQLDKLGVDVKLGKEVTPDLVDAAKPEVVIVASGSQPMLPDIPGIDSASVTTAEDVLLSRATVGEKVIVLGGGTTGAETADFLAEQGKQVTIVEMLEDIAADMNWLIKRSLLLRLAEKKVAVLTRAKSEAVEKDGVVITRDGHQERIKADTVVVATGAQSNVEVSRALQGKGSEIYQVGDCVKPRSIMEAIHEGAEVARLI